MANFKFLAAIFLIVSGSVVNQPVAAQTLSTLDFWLSFGELLTEDVLMKLTQVKLPPISLPQLPSFTLPSLPSLPEFPALPSLPSINFPDLSQLIPVQVANPDGSGTPIIVYVQNPNAVPSAPARPLPAVSSEEGGIFYNNQRIAARPPHGGCKGGKCLPENVRIVVVDDCNEQKHSESSESDERPIQVYQKKIRPTKCSCRRPHPHPRH